MIYSVTTNLRKHLYVFSLTLLPYLNGCSLFAYDDAHHFNSISINATPSPAMIYVNGALSGFTPLDINLQVLQDRGYQIVALPIHSHQHMQNIILTEGKLPTEILFYMDIPSPDLDHSLQTETAALEEPVAEIVCDSSLISPQIYFTLDTYELSLNERKKLEVFACQLHAYDFMNISLNGYADESGEPEYNIRLSLLRANAVKEQLVLLGIPEAYIDVFGSGEVATWNADLDSLSAEHNRKVSIAIDQTKIGSPQY
jgi:outer membrane protein OmpA-like peptidoglycan-associated protein